MKNIILALLVTLAICLGGTSAIYAQAIGSPAGPAASSGSKHIATAQVVVGSSPTLLVKARPGRRSVTIEDLSGVALLIGDAAVTVANGYVLGSGLQITLQYKGALYGVGLNGSPATASILELYDDVSFDRPTSAGAPP